MREAAQFAHKYGCWNTVTAFAQGPGAELHTALPSDYRLQCLQHAAVFGSSIDGVLYLRAADRIGGIYYGLLLRTPPGLIQQHLDAFSHVVDEYLPFVRDQTEPPSAQAFPPEVVPRHAVDYHTIVLWYRIRRNMFDRAVSHGPWPTIRHLRPFIADQWCIKKGNVLLAPLLLPSSSCCCYSFCPLSSSDSCVAIPQGRSMN